MQIVDKGVTYVHSSDVHNLISPRAIVPELMKMFSPSNVLDVGCGIGTFLYVFEENGVHDILGLDGDWVKTEQLYISKKNFLSVDLQKPYKAQKQYDLVLCLEVAEHLTSNAADILVNSLVSAGKVIVFSAAIPNQGGFNHINEQPHSYWQKKFLEYNYVYYDIFRKKFWNNNQIAWWYKQNMFLIAHKSIEFPETINCEKASENILTYIHPELLSVHDIGYESKIKEIQENMKSHRLSRSVLNKLKNFLNK